MTVINLTRYENRIKFKKMHFQKIIHMCNNITKIMTTLGCEELNGMVSILLGQTADGKKYYYMILGETSRAKKALFKFMDNVYKELYGTLTQGDGENIDKQISMLQESNERVLRIAKEQTRVLKSNLGILNKTMNNFSRKKEILNNNFNKIEYRLNTIN